MPHLRYRDEIMWRVSGDEFFIPALFSLVGRSFWLILLILLLALYFPQLNSCVESQLILFFLFFSIVFSGLLICTDLAIAFVSLRGSIGEVNYRKPLIPLFLVRAILSVLLVLATVVGIVGLSMNGRVPCGATIETTKVNEGIMAFIIPTQFFDLLVSFCCLFGCRVRHSEFREVEVDDASSIHSSLYDKENKSVPSIQTINESVVDRWEQSINRGVKVMRYLGCSNLGGGNVTEGFEDVARVFSKLFYHEGFVDIVVSDIVAGIILVRYEQLTQRKDAFQNLQEQQQNQTGQNFPFWNVSNSSDDIDIQYEFTSSGVDSKANQESNDITAERIAKDGNADKNKREGVGKKVTLLPQGVVREVVSDFVEQTNTLIQDETQEPQQSTTDARNSIREQQGNSNSVDLPMLRDIGKTALLASYLYSKTYTLPTTETSHGETSGNATTSKTWKSSLQHCFDLLCFNVTSMCHRAPMAGMAYCCGFWCGSKLDQRGDNATSNSISKRFGKETSHLEQNFHGINFLALDYTNLPTFLERISGTELIYISTQYAENDVYHKPYAVFIDHSERRIIVAIRGTMSIEDAVTDVMCNPEEMGGWGKRYGFDGEGRYAHSGMLRVAMTLRQELEENGLLGFFNSKYIYKMEANTKIDVHGDKPPFQDGKYELLVTGHSLGAGVAVLLAMALRPLYDTMSDQKQQDVSSVVRCIVYGVPGGLVDKKTAEDMKSYVVSVLLGHDMIPRTSFASLCKLRDDILNCICRAKVSKTYILQSLLRSADEIDSRDFLYESGQEPDTEFKRTIEKYIELVKPTLEELARKELLPPGKIVHFVKAGKVSKSTLFGLSETVSTTYAMTYGKPEEFQEIAVSTTMVTDHLPHRYYKEIFAIVRNKLHLL